MNKVPLRYSAYGPTTKLARGNKPAWCHHGDDFHSISTAWGSGAEIGMFGSPGFALVIRSNLSMTAKMEERNIPKGDLRGENDLDGRKAR